MQCYAPVKMRERLVRLSRWLGPPLVVGLVLGLLGPFGTYQSLAAGPRLAYWLAVISMNWFLTNAIVRQAEALAGDRLPMSRISVPLLGAWLAALPETGIMVLANGLSGIGWPANMVVLLGQVLVLLTAITLPIYTLEEMRARLDDRRDQDQPAAGAPTKPMTEAQTTWHAEEGPARFAARLPRPIGGQLLCLETQDHYLVIHHSRGSEMILCRMKDAARELDGLGLRVHRSWWVARDAVASVERDGHCTFLCLTDTRRVPVGRSFRADLKAAGWL